MSVQHVTVTVPSSRDLPGARAFYALLGGVELHRPPALAADTAGFWMGFGAGTQVHVIVGEPAATEAHFALVLGASYDDVVAALRDAGVRIRTGRDLWGGRRSFAHDPVGNLVELFDAPPPSAPLDGPDPWAPHGAPPAGEPA